MTPVIFPATLHKNVNRERIAITTMHSQPIARDRCRVLYKLGRNILTGGILRRMQVEVTGATPVEVGEKQEGPLRGTFPTSHLSPERVPTRTQPTITRFDEANSTLFDDD